MKKILLLAVVFIYFIYPIQGYTAGELYTVTNISKCYGNYSVKVRGENNIVDGEYSMLNSTGENNIWIGGCNDNGNDIQILTDTETNNVYDITVEYYLMPLTDDNITNDSNKRTLQFTNIGFKSVKEKEPFKMPQLEDGRVILGVVGGIVLFIGLIIFLLWKFVFKDEGDIGDRQTVREIDDYIRKYSK